MINSNTTKNFIIKRYTEEKKYLIQNKKQSYGLVNLNGTSLGNNSGQINTKTIPLLMTFQKYYKKLIFNIINMISHDIVLRVLWLKKHNPQINWK